MTSFERGDVVLCQFPYSDRNVRYRRPTLVVSTSVFNTMHPVAWVMMITSADNDRWHGDVDLGEHYRAGGLKSPSVVRTAKISNVELAGAIRLGAVPDSILSRVIEEIRSNVGMAKGMKSK